MYLLTIIVSRELLPQVEFLTVLRNDHHQQDREIDLLLNDHKLPEKRKKKKEMGERGNR